MKVIVADKISSRGVQLLKEQPGWNVVLTTKDNLVAEIADAQALIVRSATKVTAELLDKAPQLRCVGRAGVGVDNIDLEGATKRGIIVMSTPGGNAVSVAEHTFALMLSLARQVPRLDKAFHEGRWEKSSAAGVEISGKTLGLIGLGRIGGEVAVRAQAFDMRVLGYDPYITEAAAKEFSVELVPLDRLLAESDFVSLHTALSPATQNLINAETLAKMKKGAFIINAARGELIEEAALANALKSGHIGGAGLDVFAVEPPKKFAAGWAAECDCDAAYRGLHHRGSGRSGHAGGGAGERLSGGGNYQECGESAGVVGRAISASASLYGTRGAVGVAGIAGVGHQAFENSHSLRRRSFRGGHAFAAQRGVGRRAERGAG